MAHRFLPGSRVRLLARFQDVGGVSFHAGQLGTVRGSLDGQTLVDFDGYGGERQTAGNGVTTAWEHADPAPWLGAIPSELLEEVDDSGA